MNEGYSSPQIQYGRACQEARGEMPQATVGPKATAKIGRWVQIKGAVVGETEVRHCLPSSLGNP